MLGRHFAIFVGIFSSGILLSAAQIAQGPGPTTGETGDAVTLTCRFTGDANSAIIEWREFSDGGAGDRIYFWNQGTVENRDPNKYEVEGGGNFDMIVNDLTLTDGGLYACIDISSGNSESANLVVIEASSIMAPGLEEGQTKEISCTSRFSSAKEEELDPQHIPQMSMRIMNYELGGEAEYMWADLKEIKTTVNYTGVWSHHGENLTCDVFTSNPPFTVQSGEEMDILHGPRDIQIAPLNNEYWVGDYINCTASGNPDLDYTWKPAENYPGIDYYFQNLRITEQMIGEEGVTENKYSCVARNTINGIVKTVNMSTNSFLVYPQKDGPDEGGSTAPGPEGWVIAIAVIIPLAVIGAAVVGGFFFWRSRNQGAPRKASSGTGGGAHPSGGPEVSSNPDPSYQAKPPANPTYPAYTGPGAPPPHAGRDSPGYGDLGIKHMNGSYPSNPNISLDDSMDERPPISTGPQYDNQVFKGSQELKQDGGTSV